MTLRAPASALILALTLLAGSFMTSATHAKDDRTITISASGETSADPDLARVSIGVQAEAATARDAVTRNNEATAKLIEALKGEGIEARDIQTSQFSVDPRYTNPRDGTAPTVTGYRVSNMVQITVRDLKRLGMILDRAVGAGANQVQGISFEASRAEMLRDEARKAAMANAIRRAKLYAAAASVELGEVLHISEEIAHAAPRPMAAGRMAMSAEVPVEAGSLTLQARVTVTFALK